MVHIDAHCGSLSGAVDRMHNQPRGLPWSFWPKGRSFAAHRLLGLLAVG
jgi:hypothetical protein